MDYEQQKTDQEWKDFFDKLREIYIEKDGNDENFEKEIPSLSTVFRAIEQELLYSFSIVDPLDRGGAAVICEIYDYRLKTRRAMKVPRPTEELMESVANESSYLSTIRHQNIVSVYALGEVPSGDQGEISYPFFVMDFIEGGAPDLSKQLDRELRESASIKDFDRILYWLAKTFLSVGRAISFLHHQDIIHFDIKPENILIDGNNQPVISDLGWAKQIGSSEENILVGFTRFYAHQDLTTQVRQASSENRAKSGIAPAQFKKEWDLFAFGKSILEILCHIHQTFPENSIYSFNFKYLHLSACRMLDGHNMEHSQTETLMESEQGQDGHKSFFETCLDLQVIDFKRGNLGYEHIDEFVYDLEKLVGDVNLLSAVPELNHYHPGRIQASLNESLAFSTRVSTIINHPVYCSLKKVQQLGFTSNVYPTATHSRFEHSLGVYGNVCEYIKSLYNDKYNPIFRQMVTRKDLELLLVAALIHDLGHYPLAHDLEELGVNEFIHENWTNKLMEELDLTGWEIDFTDIQALLQSRKITEHLDFNPNIKIKLLGSLLNGAIDCDKIDYLIRDSHECCLKYGYIVDKDRLIRGLTTVVAQETSGASDFDIGVYNQAYTAAQALSFARYMMYQTVYWHKTVRAFRVMLKEAAKTAIAAEARRVGKRKINFLDSFNSFIGDFKHEAEIGRNSILLLIKEWADDIGSELIDLILNRIPYKRILTSHNNEIKIRGRTQSLQLFRQHIENPRFVDIIKTELVKRVDAYYKAVETRGRKESTMWSFEPDEIVDKLTEKHSIIVDFPEPSEGTKRPLRIMLEPSLERRNLTMQADAQEGMSERWATLHGDLMGLAAKCRIYCHPDVRDGLLLAVPPSQIKEIFISKLQEMSG